MLSKYGIVYARRARRQSVAPSEQERHEVKVLCCAYQKGMASKSGVARTRKA